MKISYPKAKTIETQINLIDAEEKGIDNGASYQFPSIVYEGWPMKEWYENYQKTKAITENISKETGKSGQVDFTYTLDTEGISMQLHFVYLILDMVHEEFLWIQRDEMCLVEN